APSRRELGPCQFVGVRQRDLEFSLGNSFGVENISCEGSTPGKGLMLLCPGSPTRHSDLGFKTKVRTLEVVLDVNPPSLVTSLVDLVNGFGRCPMPLERCKLVRCSIAKGKLGFQPAGCRSQHNIERTPAA